MDRAGRELFAGAALAEQKDVLVEAGEDRDLLAHLPDRGGLADEAEAIGLAEGVGRIVGGELREAGGAQGEEQDGVLVQGDDVAACEDGALFLDAVDGW